MSPSDIFLHAIFLLFLFSPPSILYCLSHLHYLLFQQVDLLFLINRHPLWSCPAPTSLFSFLSFTPHLTLWFPPPVCGCFLHSAGESARHFSIMIKANLQCSASRHHSTSKIYALNIWQHFRDHSHTSGRFCASPEKWERELAEKPGPVYNLHRKNTDESNYTLGKHKTKQKKCLKNMGWNLSLR